jgi:predicted nucleic acid-binding protein
LRHAGVVAWWGTAIEGRGAFVRLQREGLLSDAAFQVSCERLGALLSISKEILPSGNVREIALQQLERFPLRAGDALQLAAALVWCGERPRGRWFVCVDRRLAAAAAAAGFAVQIV